MLNAISVGLLFTTSAIIMTGVIGGMTRMSKAKMCGMAVVILLLHYVAGPIFAKIARWYRHVPESGNNPALEELDAATHGDDSDLALRPVARLNRPSPSSIYYAKQAKFHFGLIKYNKANYLMVRIWLRNQLEEVPNLRHVDKFRILDEAAIFTFLPTKSDLSIREMMLSDEVAERFGSIEQDSTYLGSIHFHLGNLFRILSFRSPRRRLLPAWEGAD